MERRHLDGNERLLQAFKKTLKLNEYGDFQIAHAILPSR
jgi:hypothetical protein